MYLRQSLKISLIHLYKQVLFFIFILSLKTKSNQMKSTMQNRFVIDGTVQEVGTIETFASGFTKRTFTVENDSGHYSDTIQFETHKDKCKLLDSVKPGDNVVVNFNIRCNEHNGRYFTNLIAWKIEVTPQFQDEPKEEKQPVKVDYSSGNDGGSDDLPF